MRRKDALLVVGLSLATFGVGYCALWPDSKPETVVGVLGPIAVEYVDVAVVDGDTVWAAWLPAERRIVMDDDAGDFTPALLAHERCHSAIADFGLVIRPDSLEERICDAMGALEAKRP